MDNIRKVIQELIQSISPYDLLEDEHIHFACRWISSGAPIFRLDGAAYPDPHLIVYFVVVDAGRSKILLTDHKKAQLWIPTGGHVEIDEHPKHTVQREMKEELGIKACFLFERPFFLTVTQTKGTNIPHMDVSLWYILNDDSNNQPKYFDKKEFNQVQWFTFYEILHLNSDPHMPRFLKKLEPFLSSSN